MSISCHFRGCKALLVASLIHVNGAIAVSRPLLLMNLKVITSHQWSSLLSLQSTSYLPVAMNRKVTHGRSLALNGWPIVVFAFYRLWFMTRIREEEDRDQISRKTASPQTPDNPCGQS